MKTFDKMKNIQIYKSCVSVIIGGYMPFTCLYAEGVETRPNFIFILTDDHKYDALGCAGNTIIQTPQLDSLAAQGCYYKNAFATTPISAASRASILTGMYERSHGFTFQKGPLKQPYVDVMYPVLLKNAGYYTGFIGKLGVGIKNFRQYFDQIEIFDRVDKYPDRRGYLHKRVNKDSVLLTEYTGNKVVEIIKKMPTDKPFCLSVCFSAPHAHDTAPEQYFWKPESDSRYDSIKIPLPKLSDEYYFNQLPKEVREGFNRTRWHWRYDTPEKYQLMMKGYYRMISEIDDEIGNIREALAEQNLSDNTVIIFMGDNGLYTGERQLAGKWLMHDVSLRIPLIIYDPRIGMHNEVDDMVLNIDVPKTILSLAGIKIPKCYQGLDLSKSLYDKKLKKRKAIMFEHLWDFQKIPSSEALRSKRWKYIRYSLPGNPEEFYDLKNDPDEKHNLILNSNYSSIIEKMRKELEKQIHMRLSERLCNPTTYER